MRVPPRRLCHYNAAPLRNSLTAPRGPRETAPLAVMGMDHMHFANQRALTTGKSGSTLPRH